MNGVAEVREQYKQAARTYIEHINAKGEYPQSVNFFQGRMSGLSLALSCLGVNSDEIREMYNTCEEEVRAEREHDRIHQAATDAANQIEREKEQEQEGRQPYKGGDEEILRQWKNAGGIYKLAAEAAEKELEQEELDAIERPASQAQVEACGDSWIAYCDKCGKAFNSNDAVRVPYREYPGAAFSHEEVSPCCGAEYSDRPKEEAEQ